MEIIDRSSRFRKGLANPFESMNDPALGYRPGNTFGTFGEEWCPKCKMVVDCDTEAQHRGSTYVYKRWCLRCGFVVKNGVMCNVPILGGEALPPAVREWIASPGQFKSGARR